MSKSLKNFVTNSCEEELYAALVNKIVKTPTPTQHNTTVGFDMKLTVQTTPPPTQTFRTLLDELES